MADKPELDIKNLIKNPGHGMIIDGIVGGGQIDSSGEILDVEGADVTSLKEGDGVLNWEHKSGDAGSSRDVVGKCVYVNKIFKESDCEDDRQKAYWAEAKNVPIIYARFRLFDGSGHPDAIACAAMIRDMYHAGEKITARYSVEGSTIEKKGNILKRSIIRAIALTLKPCNKSSVSSIVEDPSWPLDGGTKEQSDPLGFLEETSKFEHPGYARLQSYESDQSPLVEDPVSKALEAGSYDTAPGSLSGGAALQREDLGRAHYIKQAKAALRDYNWHKAEAGKADFKEFLKSYLPSADPEFINHFADMVDDYRVGKKGMKKAEDDEAMPLTAGLMESIKNHSYNGKKAVRYIVPETMHPKLRGSHNEPTTFGMVHGKDEYGNIKPAPSKRSEAYFDNEFGYLHTPRGSFKMSIPDESFDDLMDSPEVQNTHDEVFKNWKTVNGLALRGKLPPEIIASASLFASAAPATPIPTESHIDKFVGNSDPAGVMDSQWNDFLSKNPELMSERSERSHKLHSAMAKMLYDNKGDARAIANLMYVSPKSEAVEVGKLRGELEQQAIAQGMGIMSKDKQPFLSSEGQEFVNDKLAEYEEGVLHDTSNFAPKTLRYSLGLLGGGNVIVQDPHLIRHMFGLPKDSDIAHAATEILGRPLKDTAQYKEKIFQPNQYLKELLWDSFDDGLIHEVERYYKENHPAYKNVVSRFWGGNRSENAILPASWLHWLAIPKHEKTMGMSEREYGGGVDHGTYWHHARTILGKYGLDKVGMKKSEGSSVIPMVAAAHNEMYNSLGPIAASVFYFHRLVPLVLGEAAANGNFEDKDGSYTPKPPEGPDPKVLKMEKLLIALKSTLDNVAELSKAEEDYTDESGNPKPVIWAGKHIQPGKATKMVAGKAIPMHVVESTPNHYVFASVQGMNRSFSKLSKDRVKSFGIKIDSEPIHLDSDAVVDSVQHTVPGVTMFPEQHDLVHGMKFEDEVQRERREGVNNTSSKWSKNAAGQDVYVKGTNEEWKPEFPLARREASYYNMARDYFGLHQYVPVATAVKHPKSGQEVAVIAGIPGAQHMFVHKKVKNDDGKWDRTTQYHPDQAANLKKLGDTGELDKLSVMNSVMGNVDRHQENLVFDHNNELRLIDHDLAMPEDRKLSSVIPAYLTAYSNINAPHLAGQDALDHSTFHPAARKWIEGLSVAELGHKLEKQGMPMKHVEGAMKSLARIKALLEKHPNASRGDVLRMGYNTLNSSMFGGSLFGHGGVDE